MPDLRRDSTGPRHLEALRALVPLLLHHRWRHEGQRDWQACSARRCHRLGKTLMRELARYQDYATETRYRLLPGIR